MKILILSIVILILLSIVGITSFLSSKYEWYLYLTATTASVTASIIYELYLKDLILRIKTGGS
jgi:hypothetical protein